MSELRVEVRRIETVGPDRRVMEERLLVRGRQVLRRADPLERVPQAAGGAGLLFLPTENISRSSHIRIIGSGQRELAQKHPGEKGGRGDGLSHFGGLSLQD